MDRYTYVNDKLQKFYKKIKCYDLNGTCINIVYDLYKYGSLGEIYKIPVECYLYLGLYYENNNNDKEMIKFFLLAIENKNVLAMKLFAKIYRRRGEHEFALIYYEMASEHGDRASTFRTINYYQTNKNYSKIFDHCLAAYDKMQSETIIDLLKMYLLRGNENVISILESVILIKKDIYKLRRLAEYYQCTHYEWSEKYYQMAIELGDGESIYKLGYFHYTNGFYNKMIDHFLIYLRKESYAFDADFLHNDYHLNKINDFLAKCDINLKIILYFQKIQKNIKDCKEKIKITDDQITNLKLHLNKY